MPIRALLPRAVAAALIGAGAGWALFALWCHGVGRLSFASALQDPRVAPGLASMSGCVALCGAIVGLCLVLEKGVAWPRAIATGLCVWLGATFFLIPLLFIILVPIFLSLGYTPAPAPSSTPPTLMQASPLLFAWCMVPWVFGGGLLLHQAYRMHLAGHEAELFQTIREAIRAVLLPRVHKQLETIVLQSPLPPDECLARWPQIAEVERRGPFAFLQYLPLPGHKPLRAKVEENHWRLAQRYRNTSFEFHIDLAAFEDGTRLRCYSRWIPAIKYYLLLWFGFLALFTIVVLPLVLTRPAGNQASGFNALTMAAIIAAMWVAGIHMLRSYLWMGKRQEVVIVASLQPTFEAHVVERKPIKWKFGLL